MVLNKVYGVIGVILTIVILFLLASNLVPVAQDSSDELNFVNQCENEGCYYNTSTSACQTTANASKGLCASVHNIPLNSVFGSTGFVFVMIMVFIFLLVIGLVGYGKK